MIQSSQKLDRAITLYRLQCMRNDWLPNRVKSKKRGGIIASDPSNFKHSAVASSMQLSWPKEENLFPSIFSRFNSGSGSKSTGSAWGGVKQTWFRSAGCLAHSQLLALSLEEGKSNVSRLLCLPLAGFLCPRWSCHEVDSSHSILVFSQRSLSFLLPSLFWSW